MARRAVRAVCVWTEGVEQPGHESFTVEGIEVVALGAVATASVANGARVVKVVAACADDFPVSATKCHRQFVGQRGLAGGRCPVDTDAQGGCMLE